MTQDEIMKLAVEAWGDGHEIFWFDDNGIERFAALVAAHEREACLACYSPDDTATDWADKIRGRNEK